MTKSLHKLLEAIKQGQLDKPMKPHIKTEHVSIEVELCSPIDAEGMATVIAYAGLSKWVNVDYDGSIKKKDKTYGLELRVMCKEIEFSNVYKKLFKVINDVGCYVNNSCGLHVHIDCRERNPHKVFDNFYHIQKVMFSMVEKHRRYNRYCSWINKQHYGTYKDSGRFGIIPRGALNPNAYNRHQTHEVRLHHATLDAAEIINWVKFLIEISNMKTPVIGFDILKSNSISEEIKTFINERIETYGKFIKRKDPEYQRPKSFSSYSYSFIG